jgi:indolepyruvate ferredoxin oxidoreductase
LVEKAKAAEAARAPGKCGLADAVARYLFKLMAYKDEYEVARLYTDGSFRKQVESQFDGDNLRFEFHLAPPLVARRDQATGLPRKMSFGPWMLPAFRLLAKLKGLRGTRFDPFGRSVERRTERKLIADYEAMLDEILAQLTPENHHLAVGLAVIPEKIRGFGHVKQRHLAAAKADEAALLEQLRSGAPGVLKAAE